MNLRTLLALLSAIADDFEVMPNMSQTLVFQAKGGGGKLVITVDTNREG